MGHKDVETRADGLEENTYSVISFPAPKIPDSYRNFILSKWMRTLRHGNEYFKLVDSDAFFRAYDKYVKLLLARTNCVVRLAVLSDDHDVALGFSLIEGDALHYVFVQHEQRNRGIGRSLVPVPIHTITHLTKIGMNAWHNKLPNAVFDPFR